MTASILNVSPCKYIFFLYSYFKLKNTFFNQHILREKKIKHKNLVLQEPLLNSGVANGYYLEFSKGFQILIKEFNLKNGQVSGSGHNEDGEFKISGKYQKDGVINFTTNYLNNQNRDARWLGLISINVKNEIEIRGERNYYYSDFYLKCQPK
jgi:hypothetical protein